MELKNLTCKCCTAPLDPAKAVGRVIRCAFCGTAFVLAREDEGKVVDLLRSGELLLDTCKFDDAFTAYQKAAELDKEEPEAYFGMALATFKVQFLKDEVNNRLQPICHEVTDKKFTEDVNYLRAFRYATNEQREEYERKGEEIDYILGEFFKLKQAGLDYDCFLCVKVTDGGGKTEDSKDADYIYELLRNKGYKPFYSERELRNVTGADYEARILYALYTSECMLVICRDEGYLQTPWVKNEYTRFLKLVNDEEKESDSITVVFYEKPIERLPGRKGKLQGIDFSRREADGKIADFVETHTPAAKAKREAETKRRAGQDEEIRRQIEEQKRAIENLQKAPDTQGGNVSIANLLVRAKRYADEFDYSNALDYYNRILDMQPNHAEAMEAAAIVKAKIKKINTDFDIQNGELIKYRGQDRDIEIPPSVVRIKKGAFSDGYSHKKIASIKLPKSVLEINSAWSNFSQKEPCVNVIYEGELKDWLKIEFGDDIFNGTSWNLYLNNELLTECVIPEGITTVNKCSFADCASIKSASLPSSVIGIGDWAFSECHNLTSVTLPQTLRELGSSVFRGCPLKELKLPDSIEDIGDVYSGITGPMDVKLPNRITVIHSRAFADCTGMRSIVVPDSVKGISAQAFKNCNGLTSISLPFVGAGTENKWDNDSFFPCIFGSDVSSKGERVFLREVAYYLPPALSNVKIRGGEIPASAFFGCSMITCIEFGDNVTSIAADAFRYCTNLRKIIIGNGVKYIGRCAFQSIGYTVSRGLLVSNEPNITIYCRAAAKPAGWDKNWDVISDGLFIKKRARVVWGYKGE